MESHFGQFARLSQFLTVFSPDFKFEKREFNKENADLLLVNMIAVLDGLFKSENLARKKNFQLPVGKTFFSGDIFQMLETIIGFLQVFNTQVLNMSKTERQTMVFILENISDYLKNQKTQLDDKVKKGLFGDYKFWIENLFRLFDKKITGSVTLKPNAAEKKRAAGGQEGELVFANATVTFSLAPFLLCRDGQTLALTRVVADGMAYTPIGGDGETTSGGDDAGSKNRRIFPGQFLLCRAGGPAVAPARCRRIARQVARDRGGLSSAAAEALRRKPAPA